MPTQSLDASRRYKKWNDMGGYRQRLWREADDAQDDCLYTGRRIKTLACDRSSASWDDDIAAVPLAHLRR